MHYNDVTMSVMASQITSLTVVYLKKFIQAQIKETSKFRVTGLCAGTGEFPAEMASNAENVSIWWRHHVFILQLLIYLTSGRLRGYDPAVQNNILNPLKI